MTYETGLLEPMLFRCISICSLYEKFHEGNRQARRNL